MGANRRRLEREHCTSQVAMLKTLCYVTRQVRGKGKNEGKGGGKEQTEREIENRGGRQRSRERSEAFSSIRGSIAAQLARRGCVTVAASVCLSPTPSA